MELLCRYYVDVTPFANITGSKYKYDVEDLEEIKAVVNAEDFELTPTNLARLVQYASQLGDMAIVWNSVVARYTERGEGVYASVIFVAKTQIAVIERLRSRIRELADGVVETPPEAVP